MKQRQAAAMPKSISKSGIESVAAKKIEIKLMAKSGLNGESLAKMAAGNGVVAKNKQPAAAAIEKHQRHRRHVSVINGGINIRKRRSA